jgi:hypothetical protein
METLNAFLAKLNSYLTEPQGGQSTRRLVYLLVMTWCLGMFTGYIARSGLDKDIIDLIKAVVYTAGGCVVGGRFAEAFDGKQNKE